MFENNCFQALGNKQFLIADREVGKLQSMGQSCGAEKVEVSVEETDADDLGGHGSSQGEVMQ